MNDFLQLSIQAKKASRGLKALMRLRSLVQGHSVKRQVASTLKCMQTIARVQSEIRARRIRMSEENQALQRQLRNRHEKYLEKFKSPVSSFCSNFSTVCNCGVRSACTKKSVAVSV